MATECRQNYHQECEAGINKQINVELYSSYFYQSLAFHFDKDDIALPGFHKYFKGRSDEERCDAEKLMKYQNERGGRIVLQDIKKPHPTEWPTGLDAVQAALQLAKATNQGLLDLHDVADKHNDVQMADFLEGEYLNKQVELIKELSDHVTNLRRVGSGLGEYQFDKETLQD